MNATSISELLARIGIYPVTAQLARIDGKRWAYVPGARSATAAEITIPHRIQLDEHTGLHEGVKPRTVGADKNYHQKKFVAGCRDRGISPHTACQQKRNIAGLDRRTTAKPGYATSLRIRKRMKKSPAGSRRSAD